VNGKLQYPIDWPHELQRGSKTLTHAALTAYNDNIKKLRRKKMKKISKIGMVVFISLMFATTTLVCAKGGFDQWGYNYQANIFNGYYENYARPETPVTDSDIWLQMKWNDAWLDENKVRHEGYPTYIDSGAWLTNHMWGTYETGEEWDYFVKIIAVSSDDTLIDGNWYDPDGILIGYVIWGQFAVIQEVSNDPVLGDDGLIYNTPSPTGFGVY